MSEPQWVTMRVSPDDVPNILSSATRAEVVDGGRMSADACPMCTGAMLCDNHTRETVLAKLELIDDGRTSPAACPVCTGATLCDSHTISRARFHVWATQSRLQQAAELMGQWVSAAATADRDAGLVDIVAAVLKREEERIFQEHTILAPCGCRGRLVNEHDCYAEFEVTKVCDRAAHRDYAQGRWPNAQVGA